MSISQCINKDFLPRKIIYRSRYMGFKELEIVFAKFLDKYLPISSLDELIEIDLLLQNHDQIIYEYIYNNQDLCIKTENQMLEKLRRFITSEILQW